MKSFTQHINEANYERFLKKNKNLSKEEIKIINTYMSQTNRKAGKAFSKKYNYWTDPALLDWSYDDYKQIMVDTPSGRKATFKPENVPGKHGDDYWNIKVKTKGFQVVIPLTQETATYLNSGKFGCDGASYCIGWDGDAENWDDIVIDAQQVPVYVTNGAAKWVVMIYPDNRKYQVWDKMNNYSKADTTTIPDFDIKKNLLTSQLKSLYDDLREDFFSEENRVTEDIDIDDATVDYDNLVEDIENSVGAWENAEIYARDAFYDEVNRIKRDTKENYEDEIQEKSDEFDELDALFDAGEIIRDELDEKRDEINDENEENEDNEDWDVIDEPSAMFDDEDLTVEEIQERLDVIERKKDALAEEISDLEDDVKTIEEVDHYDMHGSEIDWSEDPPDEDYMYDDLDVDIPSVDDSKYADYIELAENHMGYSSRHSTVDSDIEDYARDGSNWHTAEEVLSANDLYHPEFVNNR